MNELSTEEMRYMIEKIKSIGFDGILKNEVVIIGVCHHASHHDIAIENLTAQAEIIASRLSTGINIVTSDKLKQMAESVNVPLPDLLNLIDRFTIDPPASAREDFEDLCITADYLFSEEDAMQKPLVENDDRPFYQRAADKGGNKRKQKYYNKQRW